MRNIYIASRWGKQSELRAARDQLEARRWNVVSRWIDMDRAENPDENFFMSDEGKRRMQSDLNDLFRCDMVVADLTDGIGRRGGVMLEIGHAVGAGKTVILIGNPATCGIFGHVFAATFPDWQTAFQRYF